jgi:hypothetical protein
MRRKSPVDRPCALRFLFVSGAGSRKQSVACIEITFNVSGAVTPRTAALTICDSMLF